MQLQGATLLEAYRDMLPRTGSRPAEMPFPLLRTAVGRTPRLPAGHADRMHARAEAMKLKKIQMRKEHQRDLTQECTVVRSLAERREIIERLATRDVSERRTLVQARAARAIRKLEAQKLCNVAALDRAFKDKLHRGEWPAASSPPPARGAHGPLAPTRLVVFGPEVLDLPVEQWEDLLSRDHVAPKAPMWAANPPNQ